MTRWDTELKRRVFVCVINGGTWKEAGILAGVTHTYIRTIVHSMCRAMIRLMREDGISPEYRYFYVSDLRSDRELWLRYLDKAFPQKEQTMNEEEDECARLRRALHDIAEEWAGAECGEPVHAQEAYAIGLAKRMYQLAADGLKGSNAVDGSNLSDERDCRTCGYYTTKAGGCRSIIQCVDGKQYRATAPGQYWKTSEKP